MILIKTKYQGVYYRESDSRNYGSKRDRCFYIKYYYQSKQIQEKVGWLSEGYSPETAREIRGRKLQEIKHGEIISEKKDLRFIDAATKYLRWAQANKKSFKHDVSRLENVILPLIGNKFLKQIKPSDIQDMIVSLQHRISKRGTAFSNATIKHHIVIIRQIYNHMINMGLYNGTNPANSKAVKYPRINNTITNNLTKDEIQRFFTVLDESPNQKSADLLRFALYTGRRRSEIFNLKWSDIDFERKQMVIRESKAGIRQYFPLKPEAMEIIKRQPEDSEYVFPNTHGEKRTCIKEYFKRIKATAGLREAIRFHDLRHTFATELHASTGDLYLVSSLMGHRSIITTQRYAHINDERKREALEKMKM